MIRIAPAIAIAITCAVASAQPPSGPPALTPKQIQSFAGHVPPEVVVLTFGIGPQIFEKFGHAAICLRYREEAEDGAGRALPGTRGREPMCFNYGVTDFEATDALIWGFLRGNQKFWLEFEPWYATLGIYEAEDRDIWEQTLPLTDDEARALEHKLLYDLDGDHRFYAYDHFFDNCTTRVRDLVDNALHGKLHAGTDVPFPLTFRQLAMRGLVAVPASTALADFIFGRRLDDTPTIWEAMFLPEVLRDEIAAKLGVAPTMLYKRQGQAFPTDAPTFRLPMLALALAFALPLLIATWRRRFERTATAWATIYLGVWGVLIWTLVAVSSIAGIRWNEAVLVMVPFDLALPFLGAERRRAYARWRVIELLFVSALRAVGVLHQPLWIPLLAAIIPHAIIAFRAPRRALITPQPMRPPALPDGCRLQIVGLLVNDEALAHDRRVAVGERDALHRDRRRRLAALVGGQVAEIALVMLGGIRRAVLVLARIEVATGAHRVGCRAIALLVDVETVVARLQAFEVRGDLDATIDFLELDSALDGLELRRAGHRGGRVLRRWRRRRRGRIGGLFSCSGRRRRRWCGCGFAAATGNCGGQNGGHEREADHERSKSRLGTHVSVTPRQEITIASRFAPEPRFRRERAVDRPTRIRHHAWHIA